MISEKWNLGLDIEKLQKHLKEHVFDKEITRQTAAFGGWSVLSYDGDYRDGWQQGHLLQKENATEEQKAATRKSLSRRMIEYTRETDICSGYLKEVIDIFKENKLSPHRARIICLTAGQACSWHKDVSEEIYCVRLHVPIFTNSGCFFETPDEREHLAADGSAYFIYVNREHRVVNHGTTDRFHLVIDVKDEFNFTQHHRLSDFKARAAQSPAVV